MEDPVSKVSNAGVMRKIDGFTYFTHWLNLNEVVGEWPEIVIICNFYFAMVEMDKRKGLVVVGLMWLTVGVNKCFVFQLLKQWVFTCGFL